MMRIFFLPHQSSTQLSGKFEHLFFAPSASISCVKWSAPISTARWKHDRCLNLVLTVFFLTERFVSKYLNVCLVSLRLPVLNVCIISSSYIIKSSFPVSVLSLWLPCGHRIAALRTILTKGWIRFLSSSSLTPTLQLCLLRPFSSVCKCVCVSCE